MKKSKLLMAIALLAACSKSSHPDYFGTIKPKHSSKELWLDASSEPQYLDPSKVAESVGGGMVENMFLRLTQVRQKTGEMIPDLAKSWDISKDGREYTFHLREDAIWSDGEPLTAEDVVYAWKRVANSETGSTYAQLADVIQNARPFREQAVQITGVDAKTNLKTLESKLNAVVPLKDLYFDSKLGTYFAFIKSDDAAEKKQFREKLLDNIEKVLGPDVKGQLTTSDVMQLKALDAHTVWVQLVSPVPYFLGLIEYPVFAPEPKHLIEKFKAEGKEDRWVRPENIVVSGPFILDSEEFKQYKIFKKNPKYFNASKVRLEKVKTTMVEEYNANLNAYQTGQHDWSFGASLPNDMIETVKKFKDAHFDPQVAVYYYQLNITRKPLNDRRVRLALSLAIDRKMLVENVARQGQKPLRDFVPHGIPGYQGPESSVYDPDTAKKLLAEAGFPGGKGFPKLTLKFNTSEGHRKLAEAIQQMWKSILGVQIDIANMEWKSMLEDQNRSNFDMLRMAWVADYMDPNTFMTIFLSESANNHTYWKNKQYDALIKASDETLDQNKRFELFREAEKILASETPMIPIYSYTRGYMKKPFLKGFWPSYQDRHPWKYMWVDERWEKGVPTEEVTDEPWTE